MDIQETLYNIKKRIDYLERNSLQKHKHGAVHDRITSQSRRLHRLEIWKREQDLIGDRRLRICETKLQHLERQFERYANERDMLVLILSDGIDKVLELATRVSVETGLTPVVNRMCCICFENPKTTALVPCGHRSFCQDCVRRLSSRDSPRCPLCRCLCTGSILLRG